MKLSLHGGRLLSPGSLDAIADLHIIGGRIAAIGPAPAGFVAERHIDAHGRLVCPGLIDLCARLREPGQTHKADIASELQAAARGGITTLVCPPDTDPVIDAPAVVELIRGHAQRSQQARVLCLGALTRGLLGDDLAEMAALQQAGCIGVADGGRPVRSSLVLKRALEYAASHHLTVFLTPVDVSLAAGGCAHDGQVATRLGLPGIPVAAETAELARILALVADTGARVHVGRLSSARAVAMLARAHADGLPVSADVGIHHLYLSEIDLGRFDAQAHLLPPLRSLRDRDALRAAVAAGSIAVVCSDHQPHDPDAKLNPFPDTEPGASGLDLLLPLMLSLVGQGVFDLPTAIARLTSGPAAVLGLDAGSLQVGAVADLCVVDPSLPWLVGPDTLASRGHNTPLVGYELCGRVTHTLLAGRMTHDDSGN